MYKDAIIKGNYRYLLERTWNFNKQIFIWIMHNPSIADSWNDDATIKKIIKISEYNGAGSIFVVNLYAYITPYRKLLDKLWEDDKIGKENNEYIMKLCKDNKTWGGGQIIIFACGRIKNNKRIKEVYKMIQPCKCFCLGYNIDASPVHPLYQKDTSVLVLYDIEKLKPKNSIIF